ncbi:CMP-N-acetylneuraminate-beta-galactosamide-alpha-2,3-sialyltransferase 4-like [Hypanus sabinus]|uniref:CMP-N-acetylneuraminate-beta-galactosamide- alpha-2,3-sialyltransferase 4-like n=1 Tax=Hypanus sabinus TaxID=79690 RepID=UPI0028C478BF|nr:CMP-N-acetylneuraminate-beta-galactosamide-alpha-2,3-sialyltransferase 4-like [Hypanus sabinus]
MDKGITERVILQKVERSSQNPNIFLTLEGDWWHLPNIVSYNLPYGIKDNENLVRQILVQTKSNMPEKINGLVCKRCVVVGNGITLKNSLLGEVINKYDIVIRLNNAPVRGYEKDVGNKTTLRFFYPESAIEDLSGENNPDMLFVLVPFKTVDLLWLKELVYNKRGIRNGFWRRPPIIKKLDISKLRILSPFYLYQAMTELLKKTDFAKREAPYATTGFLAVTVALNYCDEVHLAGFGYPLNQKTGLIHYFDNVKMEFMYSYLLFHRPHPIVSKNLPLNL